MQKKEGDTSRRSRLWRFFCGLLLFPCLAGCGLCSVPYEEPLYVQRMGNLQMALPEEMEAQTRFSAYASEMAHGKLVVMEQPCHNPEKAGEEFAIV